MNKFYISEDTIQKTFKDWCDKQDFIQTHWHVPNGLKSNSQHVAIMKKLGLRAGVWDYWIILKNGVLAVIEFKTEIGKLSKEQIEFEKSLVIANIPHKLCRSAYEANCFLKSLLDK